MTCEQGSTPSRRTPGQVASDGLLGPLASFYAAAGLEVPAAQALAASALPPVARTLLDHQQDMTGTLEAFVGVSLRLRLISVRRSGSLLVREVVLVTDDGRQRPIEFGAIRIDLDRLGDEARRRTVEGVRPLGGILNECGVTYRCAPQVLFSLSSDPVTAEALALEAPTILYGRRNVIHDRADFVLAEVIEILAPLEEDRDQ